MEEQILARDRVTVYDRLRDAGRSMTRHDLHFALALSFAVLFALTGWIWQYLANVFLAVPFWAASWAFRRAGLRHDAKPERYRFVVYVWWAGLAASLLTLVVLMLHN